NPPNRYSVSGYDPDAGRLTKSPFIKMPDRPDLQAGYAYHANVALACCLATVFADLTVDERHQHITADQLASAVRVVIAATERSRRTKPPRRNAPVSRPHRAVHDAPLPLAAPCGADIIACPRSHPVITLFVS